MVNVDKLLGLKGDVRKLLGLLSGEVSWSDQAGLARLEVLTGLQFKSFRVSDAVIGLNFVSCDFTDCYFENIQTDGHLWGARDSWRNCEYKSCELKGMIAPMNSFVGCRFEKVILQSFRPYQTVLVGAVFSNVVVRGLRAQTIRNSQMVNPDTGTTRGQLIFRDCRFESTAFEECNFEEVAFERCSFSNVDARSCSFDGVISDAVWWSKQEVDPFTAFLGKALELIRTQCGGNSAAYKEFENYTIEYGSGRTTNRDFSACLYNNRVPYAETQRVIKGLRKLVK